MVQANFGRNLGMSLAIAAAVLPVQAALADVKAGVEAWTQGDYPTAVREWQGPADKGDADALFNLGQAYKLGRGVKADLRKAEELFGRAAEKGHLQASDNYGLLLFQRGERVRALPYVRAAADRGEPRAQYLLGVAHFNGDNVPKDWVRAYALTSLALQGGLQQAQPALTQMDQYIPIEQRQQGAALARELASQADATRTRQLASADLGSTVPVTDTILPPAAPPRVTPRPAAPPPASTTATAADAAAIARAAADNSPRNAGADYARPRTPTTAPTPTPRPAVAATTAPPPPASRPANAAIPVPPRPASPPAVTTQPPSPSHPPAPRPAAPASAGPWRVQLGAFSVASNANALWDRLKGRPELAGHPRLSAPAGKATKLYAGGFASREDAQSACSRLTSAGFACLVTRD